MAWMAGGLTEGSVLGQDESRNGHLKMSWQLGKCVKADGVKLKLLPS